MFAIINFLQSLVNTYKTWWLSLYYEAPHHILVETSLALFIIWLLFIRRTVDPDKSKDKKGLTEKEIEWLIDTWQPEPLVPMLSNRAKDINDSLMIIESINGNYAMIRGKNIPVLNLASFDFLGLGQLTAVKEVSQKALEFYGCGSCGPRGFYGTIDMHLKFESEIAKFMNTQEAISYSDSAAAVSSTIAAFAKRGDLLLVDEACCEPIRTGLLLSRGTVQTFRHNDMTHLHAMLESIASDDIRLKRDSLQQRRFIVVEGLYRNTGDLCPLRELVELKEKFYYRLILDESLSFGVIGSTGRGVTEYFGVDINDVEILNISMDTTLASVGGLCVGSREVVDHQRLSGTGYCYSASAPPFFSAAALLTLAELERSPERLATLQHNTKLFVDGLHAVPNMSLASGDLSERTPVLHLRLKEPKSWETEEAMIRKLVKDCVDAGVGVVCVNFASCESPWKALTVSKSGTYPMPECIRPSLRVCVTASLTERQIQDAVTVITKCAADVIN